LETGRVTYMRYDAGSIKHDLVPRLICPPPYSRDYEPFRLINHTVPVQKHWDYS